MNPYEKVLEEAKKDIQRKREAARFTAHKWESIWSYLDEEDVYGPDGRMRQFDQIRRRAFYKLQSYVYTNDMAQSDSERIAVRGMYARNTEFEAIWSLFEMALTKEQWRGLRDSQRETTVLDQMAQSSGVNSARLISNVLSITVNAAYKRLQTAYEKTYNINPEFDIIEIKDALESTPRYCPFCLEQSRLTRIPVPTRAMCWEHHKRFVLKQDFGIYPRDEFERVIMDANRDYWETVRGVLDTLAS